MENLWITMGHMWIILSRTRKTTVHGLWISLILTEKELSDLMKLVEGSTNLPAREAAKIGKLVDPAKAAGKTARSGYQGKKNDRKPFVKNGERKPFEKKSGTGKIWRNVREDSEKKPEKKAPASPESWKPGAPERKEHKIWMTRSRG